MDERIRLRLDVSYDGTGFSGWAAQPTRRTVAGVLVETLDLVLGVGTATGLTVAGRTDAGVHATGQVCHVDLPVGRVAAAEGRLLRRLARLLPTDVRVRAMTEVPADFDARFSATFRRYEYRVTDAPFGAEPLRRHEMLAWPKPAGPGRAERRRGRAGGGARLRRVLPAQGERDHAARGDPAGLASRPGRHPGRHGAGRRVLPGDGAQPGRCHAGGRGRPPARSSGRAACSPGGSGPAR